MTLWTHEANIHIEYTEMLEGLMSLNSGIEIDLTATSDCSEWYPDEIWDVIVVNLSLTGLFRKQRPNKPLTHGYERQRRCSANQQTQEVSEDTAFVREKRSYHVTMLVSGIWWAGERYKSMNSSTTQKLLPKNHRKILSTGVLGAAINWVKVKNGTGLLSQNGILIPVPDAPGHATGK